MKNHIHILIIIISLFIGLDLSGQVKNIPEVSGLIIDPKIKNEVARYIIDSSYENYTNGPMQFAMYQNRLFLELYQNDKLVISMKDSAPVSLIFKSFFYWSHDTLSIDGAFGMWEGMGFTIRIVNNKATLYNMLSADEFPFYAYKPDGELLFRLNVPCTKSKIILSELPDSSLKQTIFGYVEFKGNDFFQMKDSQGEKEILPRDKCRANMRIYFKSKMLKF